MRDLETSEDCGARRRLGRAPRHHARLPIYQGNPLQSHRGLAIAPEHFARWLELWREAVDDLFHGPTAAAIVERAQRIAVVLSRRLAEAP